jgi:hypothetical protein
MEKISPKYWTTFVIFKKQSKVGKQSTNGRNFAQSGHPDAVGIVGITQAHRYGDALCVRLQHMHCQFLCFTTSYIHTYIHTYIAGNFFFVLSINAPQRVASWYIFIPTITIWAYFGM